MICAGVLYLGRVATEKHHNPTGVFLEFAVDLNVLSSTQQENVDFQLKHMLTPNLFLFWQHLTE